MQPQLVDLNPNTRLFKSFPGFCHLIRESASRRSNHNHELLGWITICLGGQKNSSEIYSLRGGRTREGTISTEAAMSGKAAEAPVLVDFDWKLKYAVSSNSLASVNKPLVRLELSVLSSGSAEDEDPRGNRKPEWIISEFTKTQLDGLISQMEAISKECDPTGADGSS